LNNHLFLKKKNGTKHVLLPFSLDDFSPPRPLSTIHDRFYYYLFFIFMVPVKGSSLIVALPGPLVKTCLRD